MNDYTSQLNTIISRLSSIVDMLTNINNFSYIIVGLIAVILILNAIKGE